MPLMSDTVTYAQLNEVLRAVSDRYEHNGVTGNLSAPAEQVLQEVWKELRNLPTEVAVRPKVS